MSPELLTAPVGMNGTMARIKVLLSLHHAVISEPFYELAAEPIVFSITPPSGHC